MASQLTKDPDRVRSFGGYNIGKKLTLLPNSFVSD